MNLSGFLFIFAVGAISLTSALSSFGTTIEQVITFISQAMTFFVLIGLFGIWKKVRVYRYRTWKFLAYSCPSITAISTLYMLIEYSEQTVPSSFIYTQGVEFIFSLVVASIFAKEASI